jgi:hypothetical protein
VWVNFLGRRGARRGDVVTLRAPDRGDGTIYIKRIVGRAGDILRCADDAAAAGGGSSKAGGSAAAAGAVPGVGIALGSDIAAEVTSTPPQQQPQQRDSADSTGEPGGPDANSGPDAADADPVTTNVAAPERVWVVPRGHLWCEGDNVRESNDSRAFGPVPESMVTGKVTHIVWPPSEWGRIAPIDIVGGSRIVQRADD